MKSLNVISALLAVLVCWGVVHQPGRCEGVQEELREMDPSTLIVKVPELKRIHGCVWGKDEKKLLLYGRAGARSRIYVYDIQEKELRDLGIDVVVVGNVWYCPSRKEVFCRVGRSMRDARLVQVDLATGKEVTLFVPESGWMIYDCEVSADGNVVAVSIVPDDPDLNSGKLLLILRHEGQWEEPKYIWGKNGEVPVDLYCAPNGSAVTWKGLDYVSLKDGQYVVQLPSLKIPPPPPGSAEWKVGAWSPEGDQMVYYDRDPDTERRTVKAYNIKTGTTRVLATLPIGTEYASGLFGLIRWSPDGRWIAYTTETSRDDGGYWQELWFVSSDGKVNTCIGRLGDPLSHAERIRRQYYARPWQFLTWKPDGSGITFTRVDEVRFLPVPQDLVNVPDAE